MTGRWVVYKRENCSIAVPQLVDPEKWHAVQRILVRASRGVRRSRQRIYLAQGISACGLCGCPIHILSTSAAAKRQHAYYTCMNRIYPHKRSERCTLPNRRVDAVDERLWVAVVRLFGEQWPEHRERLLASAMEWRGHQGAIEHDLKRAREELARLDGVEAALLARFGRGLISETALDAELTRITQERRCARADADTAEARLGHSGLDMEALERVIESARGRLADAPMEMRRQLVTELIPGTGDYRVIFGADGSLVAKVTLPWALPSAR